MLHLYKHFISFETDVRHLALRLSILNTLCYLAYLYIPGYHPAFICAAIAVFIVGLIETIGIKYSTKRRISFGLLMSFSSGVALILGSMASQNIWLMSIGILLFMLLVALSSSAKSLPANTILFTASMFIIGSNFPTTFEGSIGYGIAFIFGGVIMTLSGYIHSLYYDLKNTDYEESKTLFNFNKTHWSFAIRLSIAVLGGYLLAILFHFNQAYCVPMTTLIVLKIDNDFAWERMKYRFAGTLLGSILALILIYFIHDKLLLTLLLLPINFLMVTSLAKHYGAYAFFLTAMITISLNIIDPQGILITEARGLDTLVGVSIAAIVVLITHKLNKSKAPKAPKKID
jgi:hypothetical protein